MYFPKLEGEQTGYFQIDSFQGLDLRESIPLGAFAQMENLTSDGFPVTTVRPRRRLLDTTSTQGGMTVRDGVCYVDGPDFVMNGWPVNIGLTEGKKELVSMGIYVLILPDKKYVNTLDKSDYGDIEAAFYALDGVTFSVCRDSGEAYENLHKGDTPPETPAEGQYWLDTSQSPAVLKHWNSKEAVWETETSGCVRLSAPGIGKDFQTYDGVQIAGIHIKGAEQLNGSAVILARDTDYLVIAGLVDGEVTQPLEQGVIAITRTMPELDYVVEAGNRLWGCRYGTDAQGQQVNEIYASKLGDFRNWSCFRGLSTDSYRASLGADGAFTGAVNYMGSPLFFREDCVHKVYGSYPAEYRIQTTECHGVAKGSAKSLAVVDGVLYYLSNFGVCAYDGALPVTVSQAWGRKRFYKGAAGGCGSKYYLSVLDEQEKAHLLVYDTARGMWHREDNFYGVCFCTWGSHLVGYDGKNIYSMLSDDPNQPPVTWMAQTGHLSSPDTHTRYISRLSVKLKMEPGSRARFFVRYDGMGDWERLGSCEGKRLGILRLPMRTRRCESLQLRVEGEGAVQLHSITLNTRKGSDHS